MENKFSDKVWQIVSLILAVSLILSIINMNDLSEKMTDLQNKYTSMADSVQSEMQNFYNKIDELVKDQSNVVLSYACDFDNFDEKQKTISAKICIVPKTFGDFTSVKIKFGDGTADALRNGNNEFTANFTFNLFDEIDYATVYVTNNGETTAQNIDVSTVGLYKKIIPTVSASFSGTSSYSTFGGKLTVNGKIDVYLENTDYADIENCRLSVTINDNEVESKVVDIKNGNNTIEFNNSYIISKNDLLEIWLVAQDSFGYEHRDYVYGVTENKDDGHAEISMPDSEFIYDSEGNRIIPKTE